MKVIELDRLTFAVTSTTKAGDTRHVDMGENEGHGICSCWRFTKHIRKALEDDIVKWRATKKKGDDYDPNPMFDCEHLALVRRFLSNKLVQAIRKAYPDDNSKGQMT